MEFAFVTEEQIEDVHRSWHSIVLLGDVVMQMFYRRLFRIDESAHALFSDASMLEQRRKFLDTFDLLVKNIEDIEKHTPMLEDLGRKHAAYGVKDHHYDAVGEALIDTIEHGLGHALTSDSRTAWAAAYERLSTPMRRAAAGE